MRPGRVTHTARMATIRHSVVSRVCESEDNASDCKSYNIMLEIWMVARVARAVADVSDFQNIIALSDLMQT
jgi:hypothetical protein